jgi:protein ERP2
MLLSKRLVVLLFVGTFASLLIGTSPVDALQYELSLLIEAGRRECFHQYLAEGLKMETDYQVIQGGQLDITFWITSPTNEVLYNEIRKAGGQKQFTTESPGEYQFCFDNSYSRMVDKNVFFFISSNDGFVDPHFSAPSSANEVLSQDNKDDIGELNDKVEDFKARFTAMAQELEQAQLMQQMLRVFEKQDRILMTLSKWRVNFYSVMNILVLVVVGALQVFMIRSLFEEKSKVGRVLRKGIHND